MAQSYVGQLHVIIQQHDDAISALGERYRVQVIIPLCRKFKLSFVVIQGDWWFTKAVYTKSRNDWHNAPHYSSVEYLNDQVDEGYRDISPQAKAALRPVLDLLDEDIAHNNPFGYHVAGVCIVCLGLGRSECLCGDGES